MTVFFSGSRRRRAAERSELLPGPCLSQRVVVRRRLAGGLPVPGLQSAGLVCSRARWKRFRDVRVGSLVCSGCLEELKRALILVGFAYRQSKAQQCSLAWAAAPRHRRKPADQSSMPFYSLRGTARVVRFLLVSYTPLACSPAPPLFFGAVSSSPQRRPQGYPTFTKEAPQ